jgi:hypothetical protein
VRFRRLVLAAAACFALAAGFAGKLSAEDVPGQVLTSAGDSRGFGEQYFVDFRARRGALFGHTFIVYGHLGAKGELRGVEYAGNYPTDGHLGLVVGSVIPVRTTIGPVQDDLTDPATIIYRRKLTAAQFAELKAGVRHLRATQRHWHLMFFNCNDLAVEVTKRIGLRSPSPWLIPHAYVTALREMNP